MYFAGDSVHPNWLLCRLSLCISLVSYFYATLGLVWQNLLLYRIVAGKIITKQCLFPSLHPRTEYAKGGNHFMPRASYVLTLPSLRAESIREKKWSQSIEWETIGHNGLCNPLLKIKRNPTYRVISEKFLSNALRRFYFECSFVLYVSEIWEFYCLMAQLEVKE